MTPHALLFTLACIGISETVYLIRKKRADEKPFCVLGETCQIVLQSKYNKTFGVPNEILGVLFYVTVSVITAFLVIEVEPLNFWELAAKGLIYAGAVMSLYFVFLQWKVLKAWCFWCMMSAFTIFGMTLVVLNSSL